MSGFYISTSKQILQIETIHRLLRTQFWSKDIPIEYISRFIEHSCCFGVYKNNSNEQVGFARVITDYTTYGYVCDLVIDEPYRGKGLASRLVDDIMFHPELQGLKAWTMRTTEDARGIYEKRGFKVAESPETNLAEADLLYPMHNAPREQYIVYLEGSVQVRASGGETKTFTAGDILHVKDTTGEGHESLTVTAGRALIVPIGA